MCSCVCHNYLQQDRKQTPAKVSLSLHDNNLSLDNNLYNMTPCMLNVKPQTLFRFYGKYLLSLSDLSCKPSINHNIIMEVPEEV